MSFFQTKYNSLAHKKNTLRQRLARNFSISFLGSLVSLTLNMGRIALLTKSMTIADFGRVLIVINVFTLLLALIGFRVQHVIYRFFPEFKKEQNPQQLSGLLHVCLFVSLGAGLFLAGGVFVGSNWIAEFFYDDAQLGSLLRVYAFAVIFLAFEGFYSSILRSYNKFSSIVIPEVVGNAITLIILIWYFVRENNYSLEVVVWASVAGILVRTTIPLFLSLKQVRKHICLQTARDSFRSLAKKRAGIISTFFQTNLIGYLKLAGDDGGMFLLGVIAGPSEVALYGIARQLSKPFIILQNNIQTVLIPEITQLKANQEIKRLYELVKKYVKSSTFLGLLVVVLVIFIAKPILLLLSKPAYLSALPVFYVLVFAIYLTFISLVFFPLALVFDQLKRRNLVVAIRFVYLGIAVVTGLNALSLAIVQVLGALTIRIFNDWPLYIGVKKQCLGSS